MFEPSTAKLDRRPGAADSPRARSPVTFFLAGEPDLDAARRLDPDRDLHAFRRGEFSWVVQTYLRLRAAGYPVELSSTPPGHGMLVFHAKHRRALARSLGRRDGLVLVAIRADNRSPLIADFEILQNGRFAGARRFAVPFWPQPRLLPREASRGTRLERVGYMGLSENLHPGFHSEAWIRDLRDAGFEWVLHAVDYRGTGNPSALGAIDWEDYRALDAIVAVRPDERGLASHKPANKLINAWRAGVPALAGAEFALRELRRSEDDYLEVSSPGEALAALHRLRGDPARYSRMVANGGQRAEEFSFAAIAERWARVLWEEIPRQLARQPPHWSRALPLPLLLLLRRARRRLSPRIH